MDSDKVPFYMTLVLAMAGWSVTYIIGRIASSPTLEYKVSPPTAVQSKEHPNAKKLTVELANLTRTTTFTNLTVVFISPTGTKILGDATEVHRVPPAFEGNEPWKLRGGLAQYTIPKVHPGWRFDVQVGFTGEKPPLLGFESADPIYSAEPSWETKFVRNEGGIFAGLLGVWVLVIGWFFWGKLRADRTRRGSLGNHNCADAIGEGYYESG